MKNIKLQIIISLLIPVICLLLLTVYKHVKISIGKTMVIPITGYDPRDILSGHYLAYRLAIKIVGECSDFQSEDESVYMCLKKMGDGTVKGRPINHISDAQYYECDVVIKGKCDYNSFTAGIERFYIPEQHAAYLDKIVRRGKCSLEVKIDGKGNAAIRDMLIDGKSWKEYLKEKPEDEE